MKINTIYTPFALAQSLRPRIENGSLKRHWQLYVCTDKPIVAIFHSAVERACFTVKKLATSHDVTISGIHPERIDVRNLHHIARMSVDDLGPRPQNIRVIIFYCFNGQPTTEDVAFRKVAERPPPQ